jgi:hypothetical protein
MSRVPSVRAFLPHEWRTSIRFGSTRDFVDSDWLALMAKLDTAEQEFAQGRTATCK